MKEKRTGWDKKSLEKNFDNLFRKFQDSIIIVSYGEPGNPSIQKIRELLQCKSDVKVVRTEYTHKLNRRNGDEMCEVLLIAN